MLGLSGEGQDFAPVVPFDNSDTGCRRDWLGTHLQTRNRSQPVGLREGMGLKQMRTQEVEQRPVFLGEVAPLAVERGREGDGPGILQPQTQPPVTTDRTEHLGV